ncbi:hypothetical protein HJC23_005973 [Cyclotella cryptica]|uniref:G domain-containing protein n=1 Tax=Cyclotella cryptica TaxID=29204 RepID=A0ABD3NXZ6_9STRA|eukprot:CCRYP_019278-RB/>CCRYP_019278-RB protein AED:0.06 eAED:0.06 QI:299/0.8/0.83/1/0.4/0.16/6/1905/504
MSVILANRLLQSIVPAAIKDNIDVATFFALLSYVLFLINWLVTTDWIDKLHLFSGGICGIGIFYLHYSEVAFLATYEVPFVALWLTLLYYHVSTWRNNFRRISEELRGSTVAASMRPFQGSIFRFFIVMPVTKNASNQWNPPPFKNTIHVLLIVGYSFLLGLHIIPFLTPMHCLTSESGGQLSFIRLVSQIAFSPSHSSSVLCCRYNYAMSGFEAHEVQRNFCSGRVRVAFSGSWSTGKTYLIGGLLGHNYSTAQSAPAPTTDKFVCVVAGAPYNDPIRSDDYEQRRHCEIMEHVNDIVRATCDGVAMANVLDVAATNSEFGDFVFFDMPGWQTEYATEHIFSSCWTKLTLLMLFGKDVSHGKIEEEFASFFRNKARGVQYEVIYNRFASGSADMSFLNQQYAKMSTGQEILSEMYTTKVHENSTDNALVFAEDILRLRSKIKSVNQTVHDNRKKMMKENLIRHRNMISGMTSLRRLKILDRLVGGDLNLHMKPKTYHMSGLEL